MMNWWNVLEISYDSDLKTIKKAYAKLLKSSNPEDDAEGYQRLREAYDAAVKYSKKNREFINDNLDKNIINKVDINKNEENKSESYSNEQIIFKSNLDINEIYNERQDTKIDLNEQVKQFLNRLNEIYNDMYLRTDLAVWEELLNSDVIWNVNSFPIIEDEIFNFLSKNKYLPAQIWTKLNDNFTWSKNEIKLCDEHSALIVDKFLKNLKVPNKLKYDYIRSINPEIADEYLYERQQAEEALKDKKYVKAYKHLKNANSLFSQDAELLRLMGDYNYELNDLEKALEAYKAAFEINNYDLKSALRAGMILASYERFSEAIIYLKTYLFYNSYDKLALNYSAYCYYYNDDLIMARENFEKLLYFDQNNKTIKKFLKNIEAQLKGKHIRKIRFNKDNLMVEEIVKKEIKTRKVFNEKREIEENNPLSITSGIKGIISIMVILSLIGRAFGHLNSAVHNTTNNNKTYEDKVNNNNIIFTKVNTVSGFLNTEFDTNIRMSLSNVKPIKYYKISEPFENRVIFSESELDQKGLRNKVENQLYIGFLNNVNIFFFVDPKCSDKTIDKNGRYEVKGSKVGTFNAIFDMIEKEYISTYKNYNWVSNGFIDASQTEIDKAQKDNESIKQVGDKKIKFLKSAKDYKESRFSGDISVHLTNIISLDLYYCKYDGKNSHYYSKKEMNQNNLWNKTWVQAYSGTIDNLNILFVDRSFSKDSIEADGGYTVEGRKYMYSPDETTNVAAEEGQGFSTIGIYSWFIDNSGLT